MGILGIANRTENWKTARCFAPFFEGDGALSNLAQRLGEPRETQAEDVHLELYWKGMRDYLHKLDDKSDKGQESSPQDLASRYSRLFPTLRDDIGKPAVGLRPLKERNYDPGQLCDVKRLYNNLRNTEIDIVLETPRHLFIGEAKGEMSLGANASLVLVHQLVRQYVMVKILADLHEPSKKVVPFVVGDAEKLKRSRQVKFMLAQRWLKRENILDWEDIPKLHGQDGAAATA